MQGLKLNHVSKWDYRVNYLNAFRYAMPELSSYIRNIEQRIERLIF